MKPDVVKEIRGINPELRIIYLLRDPIERSWSSALMSLSKRAGRPPESITDEELMRHFEGAGHTLGATTCEPWTTGRASSAATRSSSASSTRSRRTPGTCCCASTEFLGVTADASHIPAAVSTKVNTSPRTKTRHPGEVRSHSRACTCLSSRSSRSASASPSRAGFAARRKHSPRPPGPVTWSRSSGMHRSGTSAVAGMLADHGSSSGGSGSATIQPAWEPGDARR